MLNIRTQLVAIAAVVALTGAGHAADIARKAPPPAPAPVLPSWTGVYVGLDLGGAWMSSRDYSFRDLGNAAFNTCGPCTVPFSSPGLSGHNDSSAFGGIFAGYNWQFSPYSGWGNWLVGVEGDISWTNLRDSAHGPLFSDITGGGAAGPIGPVPGSLLSFHTDVQWVATARARLGWLWTPNVLLYATGGAAWARFDDSANASCPVVTAGGCGFGTPLTVLNGAPFSSVRTDTGWVAGGGVEWQVVEHVRLRVEYLYYHFSDTTDGLSPFIATAATGGHGLTACIGPGPCLASYGFSGNMNIQTVRGGISYNF